MTNTGATKKIRPDQKPANKDQISPLMHCVSRYIVRAAKNALPKAVTEATKHHLLDTLAAIVSGQPAAR